MAHLDPLRVDTINTPYMLNLDDPNAATYSLIYLLWIGALIISSTVAATTYYCTKVDASKMEGWHQSDSTLTIWSSDE